MILRNRQPNITKANTITELFLLYTATQAGETSLEQMGPLIKGKRH